MLHICTAGASAASPYGGCDPMGALNAAGGPDEPECELRVCNRPRMLRHDNPDNWLILIFRWDERPYRTGADQGDEVVLLCSDTREGKMCGDALASFVPKAFPGVQVDARMVDGLQVQDLSQFWRGGVPRLFAILHEITRAILQTKSGSRLAAATRAWYLSLCCMPRFTI